MELIYGSETNFKNERSDIRQSAQSTLDMIRSVWLHIHRGINQHLLSIGNSESTATEFLHSGENKNL